MRHQKKHTKLRSHPSRINALMRNLAASIILYEKVKTTESRAKRVKSLIEKLINIAKEDNKMLSIRKLNKILFEENASKKLIEKIADRYKERKSGYTRITRLKFRVGDNAPQVQIELV